MNRSKKIDDQILIELDEQIQQTVQDIGRLSSYSQASAGEVLSKVKAEKIKALHQLREKRVQILEKHSKS